MEVLDEDVEEDGNVQGKLNLQMRPQRVSDKPRISQEGRIDIIAIGLLYFYSICILHIAYLYFIISLFTYTYSKKKIDI